jgi:hypothetical protein
LREVVAKLRKRAQICGKRFGIEIKAGNCLRARFSSGEYLFKIHFDFAGLTLDEMFEGTIKCCSEVGGNSTTILTKGNKVFVEFIKLWE